MTEMAIPPLLVVTDLRTLGEHASAAEAQAFSEFIRKSIEKTGQYRLLSRSSMNAILKSKGFQQQCHELPCFAQMGKLLGADQVLAGHLQKRGELTEVTLRLIDAKNGRFISNVYREAHGLSFEELIGEWGIGLIAEAFRIERRLFYLDEETTEVDPQTDEEKQHAIPEAVRTKFPGMLFIPSGDTVIGSNTGDPSEFPPHIVFVNAFYIDQYEVTNQKYSEFVQATNHRRPIHWKGGVIPAGLESHPVTWVSFEDAEAYCEWRGGRLPTEAEWERAAHGSNPLVFPWGDNFDPNRANTWESNRKGTSPVGSYPFGESPFGVEDMAGNVFEWIGGFFEPYPGTQKRLPDYKQHLRLLRGGAWNFDSYYARTTHRFPRSGGEVARSYGFRMARNP